MVSQPALRVGGQACNPVWSPDGNLIVYGGKFFTGRVELLGVRPDGTRRWISGWSIW